jgi:aspartyl-tRNA(Asn)/glutamyl-tRNA(Gln) amidotransferase subunit C
MLAAASAVPRLRLAALPQPLRRPLGRSQRLLTRRRPLSSSVPNVTPAAGAGELEPPDLPRLATAARISLSPQEVRRPRPLYLSICNSRI